MYDMDEAAYRRLERLKFALTHTRDLQQATVAFEHVALKPLFLINGGALVVVVAFLGSDASQRINISLALFAVACWAFGLILASASAALGYFSQLAFYKAASQHLRSVVELDDGNEALAAEHVSDSAKFNREANTHRNYAHWFGGISMIMFLAGVFFAVVAILAPA